MKHFHNFHCRFPFSSHYQLLSCCFLLLPTEFLGFKQITVLCPEFDSSLMIPLGSHCRHSNVNLGPRTVSISESFPFSSSLLCRFCDVLWCALLIWKLYYSKTHELKLLMLPKFSHLLLHDLEKEISRWNVNISDVLQMYFSTALSVISCPHTCTPFYRFQFFFISIGSHLEQRYEHFKFTPVIEVSSTNPVSWPLNYITNKTAYPHTDNLYLKPISPSYIQNAPLQIWLIPLNKSWLLPLWFSLPFSGR